MQDHPINHHINNLFSQIESSTPYFLYNTLSLLPSNRHNISQDEIKKAYRQAALRCHPDKHMNKDQQDRERFSREFLKVGVAWEVLGDEARRKRYDETGLTDETMFAGSGGGGGPGEGGWESYFQAVFKRVDMKMLDEDKVIYQGSLDEKNDIYKAYIATSGSLSLILESIPHSSTIDEPRFIELINTAISSGELEKSKEWDKSTKGGGYEKGLKKREAKERKEAVEAEKAAKELGIWEELYGTKRKGKNDSAKPNHDDDDDEEGEGQGGTSNLEAIIRARQKSRSGAMDALFARYSEGGEEDGKKEKKGKRKDRDDDDVGKAEGNGGPPELDDVDFEAFQKKLFADKQRGTKQGGTKQSDTKQPKAKKVRKRG